MKQIRVLTLFFLLAAAISCDSGNYVTKTITITQVSGNIEAVSTKTGLSEDGATVLWNTNDTINVMAAGKSAKFAIANESPSASGVFTGNLTVILSGIDAFSTVLTCGAYPYSDKTVQDNASITLSVPSAQIAREGSFDSKAFPSLACASGTTMNFYNVCGGLCFTLSQPGIESISLSGEKQEPLAGKTRFGFDEAWIPSVFEVIEPATRLTLSAPSGETLRTGVWYYVSTLPQDLKNGFSVTFNKQGSSSTKTFALPVTIPRSGFLSYENIDSSIDF